ncbi:hypothetical protein CEXT_167911, partial [Caerostris extrusa]
FIVRLPGGRSSFPYACEHGGELATGSCNDLPYHPRKWAVLFGYHIRGAQYSSSSDIQRK